MRGRRATVRLDTRHMSHDDSVMLGWSNMRAVDATLRRGSHAGQRQAREGLTATLPDTATMGYTPSPPVAVREFRSLKSKERDRVLGIGCARVRTRELPFQEPAETSNSAASFPPTCRKHLPVMAQLLPALLANVCVPLSPDTVTIDPAGSSLSGCSVTDIVVSVLATGGTPLCATSNDASYDSLVALYTLNAAEGHVTSQVAP
mmetsp:Transcript_5403/g.12584  ORF Transcript_5403/g.12584 Transcript_5403/m.12584 type:complete len:204 (-) Transcript_5403:112-723(-)